MTHSMSTANIVGLIAFLTFLVQFVMMIAYQVGLDNCEGPSAGTIFLITWTLAAVVLFGIIAVPTGV
jgi:hypothetical protein